MKRFSHILLLLTLLLTLLITSLIPSTRRVAAQDDPADAGSDSPALSEADQAILVDGAPEAPWVEASWLLSPQQQRLSERLASQLAPASVTQSWFGDWSNGAAFACMTPLAIANNAAFGAGLVSPPPFDRAPAITEYFANLGLKRCGPVLFPPDYRVRTPQGESCSFTFNQPRASGAYKNYLGITLPWGDLFPGKAWGDFGQPLVVHWNSDVEVSLETPRDSFKGHNQYELPVGVYDLTWRGETQMSLLDFVPRYLPGWAWTRLNKLTKLEGVAEEAAETTLETVLDLWAGEWEFIPTWSTEFNEETQRVAVLDRRAPALNGPSSVGVEAIEPGGISRDTLLSQLKRTLTVSDNCDANPEIIAQNELALPSFLPVGSSYTVQWVAEDRGPIDRFGGKNQSNVHEQTFTVGDSLPPVIVAPPDIVTELPPNQLPAEIALGNPGTFDLADLNPWVANNACGLVPCPQGVPQFPAGKTTITWTALDASGNRAQAEQYVNVKPVGSNNRPSASDTSADAVSYEPVTITLNANDPDGDRLWFEIEDGPDHGFFRAPLYPYFIQDYRLANVEEIDFGEYCSKEENRGTYIPTNWPVDARFMDVADDGTVYVQDSGIARCGSHDDSVSRAYRVAIFRPDGTYDEVGSDFDVKDMEVDWRNERLITARHDIGGSYSVVRIFDLDLNLVEAYRIDDYFREPKQAAIDFERRLLYVTNGSINIGSATLAVLYLPEAPPGHVPSTTLDPVYLGEYDFTEAMKWQELELDSQGNLYASEKDGNRIYKWTPAAGDEDGRYTPGELVGWLGRCDSGPGCDIANGRSFGYSCTDDTCSVSTTAGDRPGQFDLPLALAIDNNDILYATDSANLRVQRFTPEGYFAGQAVSECDGSCFVLGDFGRPSQVTVNSDHFYVLNRGQDLLHVFKTTPITRLNEDSAELEYQSDNNFTGRDTFTYRAGDGLRKSPPARVAIDVARNFRPPVAIGPLAVTTMEDEPVDVPVESYDPDEELDTLVYRVAEPAQNGQVSINGGRVTYLPDADFAGTDAFSYVAHDGRFASEPQEVTVTITPVDDPPPFPEGDEANRPAGIAVRAAANYTGFGRLAPLGTADDPLRVGRGFKTVFSISFEDPDADDPNMVRVNWGDGSPVEPEGKLLEDGTMTGPVLADTVAGGTGSATAEHIFMNSGRYDVNFCISDNVAVNDNGDKSLTPSSTTRCKTIPVEVAPMVDLLVDIQPSANPYAAGDPLSFDLVVTNQAPEGGNGLTATGIRVVNTLDSRLSVANASLSGGSCRTDGVEITCSVNPLAPGESRTIRIAAGVPSSVQPGMVLASHVSYAVDQENQADVPANGDLVSVVAPADFVVNTVSDDGDAAPGDGLCATADGACSLRAAVQEANQRGGSQRISLADWQILLQGELVITDDLTITGLGAGDTVIGGSGEARLLRVSSGAKVTLDALTLQGGATTGDGGALYNEGQAVLAAVQISGSRADGRGGGIFNTGQVTITDSSITGNSAGQGAGGIANDGTLLVQGVTVSGNSGASGGIGGSGSATLESSTVSGNEAGGRGGGFSGNAYELRNTIVAGNTAAGGGPDCSGAFTSRGFNLLGRSSGCSIAQQKGSDISGQDARLESPDLNGGTTLSAMPQGGSPAVDAGACDRPADQRGVGRPVDGDLDGRAACDIGAVEYLPLRLMMPLVMR